MYSGTLQVGAFRRYFSRAIVSYSSLAAEAPCFRVGRRATGLRRNKWYVSGFTFLNVLNVIERFAKPSNGVRISVLCTPEFVFLLSYFLVHFRCLVYGGH
jgi:hypothetical protein